MNARLKFGNEETFSQHLEMQRRVGRWWWHYESLGKYVILVEGKVSDGALRLITIMLC